MDITDLFGGGSEKAPEIEPAPTQDDAANALEAQQEQDQQRRALLAGQASTNLTGTGVSSDMTGMRMLTSAR